MREETKKAKVKKFLIILSVILIILVLSFSGFKILTSSKLTNVTLQAQDLTCTDKDQVLGYLKSLNISYFSFKKEELEMQVKQKFFCIGKIDTEISFPDKLNVQVWGRNPAFIIKDIMTDLNANPQVVLPDNPIEATESTRAAVPAKYMDEILKNSKEASESALFLVDEEGVIFNQIQGETNLPMISLFSQELKVGGRLQSDLVKKARDIINKLVEMNIPSDNIIIIEDRLIVDSKPRILFSLNRPLDRQTASLQLIVAEAKMNSVSSNGDEKFVESIDLRFNKPIVIYSKIKK